MNNKDKRVVPVPAINRMPFYLAFVKRLKKAGKEYVSSTLIADYMGIDSTQVTKDLSYTDIVGKTRVGYEVESFITIINEFLGFSTTDGAFLVGAGSLGSALLHDTGLLHFGLDIEVAFDVNVDKVGQRVNGVDIMHIDQFRDMAAIRNVKIGIISVPVEQAQTVTDLMVAWGIKAIWNFTPCRLKVPEGIIVENTMMYSNLAVLFNRLDRI
jgi:redox-sensing transcriptional repressor